MSPVDRFYTPNRLAETLLEALHLKDVNSCADPTCGYGQLLISAEMNWPSAHFVGLDIDRQAVKIVRRYRPQWTVSVGDIMSSRSFSKTRIFRNKGSYEVLLTNPPFSMGADKGVIQAGSSQRCSVAMAHILASIRLFNPKRGIGAIVPESFLYSNLDETARDELAVTWAVEQILCAPESTFKGSRARSTVVVLRPKEGNGIEDQVSVLPTVVKWSADLVRGGLPVHQASYCRRGGRPFIHSTDLSTLADGTFETKNVFPLGRGCVVGTAVLLPRVGVPSIEQITAVKFTRPVQLSDCVIALRFKSHDEACAVADVIRAESESLIDLYRGTGARYITVRRLEKWCVTVGIEFYITGDSTAKDLVGERIRRGECVPERLRMREKQEAAKCI